MTRNALGIALALAALPSLATDYGAPLPADAAPAPLAAVLARPDALSGDTVVASGRIGQVCQKKGCWLTLTDGEESARVMTRHKFFVPTDASGDAIVVGTISRHTFDAEGAQHFNDDAGGKGRHLAAGSHEWRIDAVSIRIAAD